MCICAISLALTLRLLVSFYLKKRVGIKSWKKIKIFFKNLLTNRFLFAIIVERLRKVSSVGRASALQAEGHRFEPCTFHQGIKGEHRFSQNKRLEVGAEVNDS